MREEARLGCIETKALKTAPRECGRIDVIVRFQSISLNLLGTNEICQFDFVVLRTSTGSLDQIRIGRLDPSQDQNTAEKHHWSAIDAVEVKKPHDNRCTHD